MSPIDPFGKSGRPAWTIEDKGQRCTLQRVPSQKLHALSPPQLSHALGIAASSSGGLFAFVNGGDIAALLPYESDGAL